MLAPDATSDKTREVYDDRRNEPKHQQMYQLIGGATPPPHQFGRDALHPGAPLMACRQTCA